MSLSINFQKVREELAKAEDFRNAVPITVENVEIAMPSAEIHGTLSVIPPEFERARERLLTLRQSLINRGEKFLSADDLDKGIDETRGR